MRSATAMLPDWTAPPFARLSLQTWRAGSGIWPRGSIADGFARVDGLWSMRHTNFWMEPSMLDESRQYGRMLRPDEQALLVALLDMAACPAQAQLLNCRVDDMGDGAMGSISFMSSSGLPRVFGRCAVSAEYIDTDGVNVSIALNLDECGGLFELDFWKVDFSTLRSYPRPADLRPSARV